MTIYKFRSLEKTKCFERKVLFEQELFFASPSMFNDPFDCGIFPNFALLDTEEKRKDFVDERIIRDFEYLNQMQINIEEEMGRLEAWLANPEVVQEEMENFYRGIFDQRFGFCSFSLYPPEQLHLQCSWE